MHRDLTTADFHEMLYALVVSKDPSKNEYAECAFEIMGLADKHGDIKTSVVHCRDRRYMDALFMCSGLMASITAPIFDVSSQGIITLTEKGKLYLDRIRARMS
jgi:hypothetical protein